METPFPMDREEKKVYQLESIYALMEKNHGLAKSSEISALGVDFRRIQKFVEEGSLTRVKNGYYTTSSLDFSEEELITALFPDGILTLESAAHYYGYLEKRPYHWKIAISKNVSKSRFKLDYPIVDPSYTEEEVLALGVQDAELKGGRMKIYTRDRLICDILKYEEKMTREDFQACAFAYIRDEKKDVAKLMSYARERKVLKKVQMMIGVWL
ncbi:MAG: type IV toxin-antitoxin system AbiEi family antitoxin domain-containing protein [Lachnospiraceae bacterium]|nr:type IV toxin-antitoxin system AbiEi family antitoxin domain-containing protein [Lachnospiraceae bacterium]